LDVGLWTLDFGLWTIDSLPPALPLYPLPIPSTRPLPLSPFPLACCPALPPDALAPTGTKIRPTSQRRTLRLPPEAPQACIVTKFASIPLWRAPRLPWAILIELPVGVLAVPCFTGNVSKYLACSGYPQLQYGSFLTLKLACPCNVRRAESIIG
jgi:hypothetical protein